MATGEKLCHNCTAKISRFVRLCDAFSLPVVTIAGTEGFVPSATDDIAGGVREAARLAGTYADATTARVSLLAGKVVGPVYTAMAAADWKIAVRGCVISPLEPTAAVSVLYKGGSRRSRHGLRCGQRPRRRCGRSGYAAHQARRPPAQKAREYGAVTRARGEARPFPFRQNAPAGRVCRPEGWV